MTDRSAAASAQGRLTARRDVGPAALSAIGQALSRRGPSALVIRAPSGAGKTHALRDILGRVTSAHRSTTAVEASLTRPFGVAGDLLGLPRPTRIPARYDESLMARLDDLVAAGPLVLAVDDLQFVDAESLGVLDQIVFAAGDVAVAVLAALRSGGGGSRSGGDGLGENQRAEVTRLLARDGVVSWELPPFDPLDLDVLVHERSGAWPGPGVRTLLAPVAGNALHLLSLVDGLVAAGAIRDEVLDVDLQAAPAPATLAASVSAVVDALPGSELDAARALAVLGAPATVTDLAAVLACPPTALLGPVQRLLDAGLLVEAGDRVAFAQDAYRSAVYDAAPAPLRRLLHGAASAQTLDADRARHVIASGSGPAEVLAAVAAAADELDNAPGVTAELLAEAAAGADPGEQAAAALAATRARALARSGQLGLAGEVAAAALPGAHDPRVRTDLQRVQLFSLSTRAKVDEALALVDAMLDGQPDGPVASPLPERTRRILTDHRAYLLLLGGRGPVPLEPLSDDPEELSLNGLVTEALRRSLLGDSGVGLEYAWAASRRYLSADIDPNEGQSSDVWPPFVELSHSGPDAARAALDQVVRLREERGAGWQTASHQMTGAAIDALSGRLGDAAVQLAAAEETSRRSELGWTAQIIGWQILLDVWRGDLPSAARRLAAWDAAPRPVEFGIPQVERARIATLDAERRYAEAAQVADRVWSEAMERRLYSWSATVAPELVRTALRAGDDGLRARLQAGLGTMPDLSGGPPRAARRLAESMAGPAYAEVPAVGRDVAEDAAGFGDGLLRLTALEEAAVATALTGERDEARTLARQAIALAEDFGARGIATRVAGRMRSAGVRLGATGTRARPDHGWESLTPTERLVVDHVARGRPGPEIARELYLSPRTVQTHVSHALAKLGLANRVELAAYAVAHGSGAGAGVGSPPA